ncbi:hypothetical protein AAY473_004895 [Plecturocebus cupreus]
MDAQLLNVVDPKDNQPGSQLSSHLTHNWYDRANVNLNQQGFAILPRLVSNSWAQMILLPWSPHHWDYRHEPLCPAPDFQSL